MSSGVTGMNGTSSNTPQEEDMVLAMLSKRREVAIKKCKSELQRYLDQPTIITSNKTFDVLDCGSERVVSKCRSCLLPETVEALMCLKDWFQAEEGLQDEDLTELEEIMGEMEL
ncbi:hypothetical protein IFM89_007285 [Coptis chinensis]|uniref:HAT C-terminal dimerisation domain-containing protein n=1 Tax=Coptis chinensis TaxID=261450 RepID=A0A835M7R3_9MAGN|nr:hypothetical protein IFM89_007285 [Coptis chinensis]